MKEIKMKKMNQAIVGAMLLAASVNSFAQVESVEKAPELVTTKAPTASLNQTPVAVANLSVNQIAIPGVVTNIGSISNKPLHKQELKGFANGLPLNIVMKQITPNGWIVKQSNTPSNKLDIHKSISWKSGSTWMGTLAKIANEYSINAVINWDEKIITLSNAVREMPREIVAVKPKKSIFELAGTEDAPVVENKIVSDVTVGNSELIIRSNVKVKDVTPVVQKPVASEWAFDDAKSLKDNVVAWGEKEGYRVVWTGEDYSVSKSVIKGGKFDAEDGPIKQLSVDYGPESRVQNPLSFQFYQNNTLVVENITFEQSGYSQYNKKNAN